MPNNSTNSTAWRTRPPHVIAYDALPNETKHYSKALARELRVNAGRLREALPDEAIYLDCLADSLEDYTNEYLPRIVADLKPGYNEHFGFPAPGVVPAGLTPYGIASANGVEVL